MKPEMLMRMNAIENDDEVREVEELLRQLKVTIDRESAIARSCELASHVQDDELSRMAASARAIVQRASEQAAWAELLLKSR